MRISMYGALRSVGIALALTGAIPSIAGPRSWDQVDGKNLRVALDDEGFLLLNETGCALQDIELKTIERNARGMSRSRGTAYYWFKAAALGNGASLRIELSQLTNDLGASFNKDSRPFGRFGIFATCTGKEKQAFGQFFDV